MRRIFLLSAFVPFLVTQASFWSFWNSGNTQRVNVSRNYHTAGEKYIDFTPAQFLKLRKKKENFALYFYANCCVTCQAMNNKLNEEENQLSSNVLKIDFDNSYTLQKKYGVASSGTFIFFREGKAVIRSINPDFETILKYLK